MNQPDAKRGIAVTKVDVRRYQCWCRGPITSRCGAGFNLSNGMEITWNA